MEIISKFFTEKPSVIGIIYLILGTSGSAFLIFHFLPKEKALNFFTTYRGYRTKKEKYDWTKTLRKQSLFLLLIFVYSLMFLIFTYLFGEKLAEVGLLLLAFLAFIASFFLEPVKK